MSKERVSKIIILLLQISDTSLTDSETLQDSGFVVTGLSSSSGEEGFQGFLSEDSSLLPQASNFVPEARDVQHETTNSEPKPKVSFFNLISNLKY
jgi:hypothetical protein